MHAFGGFAREHVLSESGIRWTRALAVKLWFIAGEKFGFIGADGGIGVFKD